jgi:hypothetical protein
MRIHQKPTVKFTSNPPESEKLNSAWCEFLNRKPTSIHIISTSTWTCYSSFFWTWEIIAQAISDDREFCTVHQITSRRTISRVVCSSDHNSIHESRTQWSYECIASRRRKLQLTWKISKTLHFLRSKWTRVIAIYQTKIWKRYWTFRKWALFRSFFERFMNRKSVFMKLQTNDTFYDQWILSFECCE